MTKSQLKNIIFLILILRLSANQYDEEAETNEPTPDIGCTTNRPALCSNGICYENYSFCLPFRGCVVSPNLLMCPSGTCTSDFSLCSDTTYECELDDHKRCSDGICRVDCQQIETNGCPSNLPFYCPTGKCARSVLECTGRLIRFSLHLKKALHLC